MWVAFFKCKFCKSFCNTCRCKSLEVNSNAIQVQFNQFSIFVDVVAYVIVQFLNWLNFISKLVQYFLNWFIFFQTSLIFLNRLIFLGKQFFLKNTGTLKKKWVVLHISLSPLSPLLITLSFCVPTLPPLLILPEHFFHSKTNNFYLNEI